MLFKPILIAIPVLLFGAGEWQSLGGPLFASDLSVGWDGASQVLTIYVADWYSWLFRFQGRGWDSMFTNTKTAHPTCVITSRLNAREVLIGRYGRRGMGMKSTDGGYTWLISDAGIKNRYPRCFVMHPESSQIIFLGCRSDDDHLADEIYKSKDGGYYWEMASGGLPADNTVNDLAITTRGIKLLAATDDGVYYSFDGGANWSQSNLTERSFAVAYGSEFIGYAGTENGLYKTTDGGVVWKKIGDFTSVKAIGVVRTDEVYIAAKGNKGRGIYQISDNDISFLSNFSARRIQVGPEGRVFILSDRGVYAYRSNER